MASSENQTAMASFPRETETADLAATGTIFALKRYAIHDGPGIRVTVFLQGCPLRCPWCHNPEGQDAGAACLRREGLSAIARNGTAAQDVTVRDVLVAIEKDRLFFDESGGGATFSGGEPLMQPQFLRALLEACKAREIHTTLDTCGHAPSEVFESMVDLPDLFLYDLKLMDDEQHQKHTGVSNRWILENLKVLAARGKRAVVRFPLIPEITDTEENVAATVDFVAALDGVRDVALLPYHKTASGKYKRLHRPNEMEGVEPPSGAAIRSIRSRFESRHLRVTVGG